MDTKLLSRKRNVSIAWQHTLCEYGVHGIHKEPAPAKGAQGRGAVGKATELEHAKGGSILRRSAINDTAVVQKGFHIWRARDTNTLIEAEALSTGPLPRVGTRNHQRACWSSALWTGSISGTEEKRSFGVALVSTANTVPVPSVEKEKSVEASA